MRLGITSTNAMGRLMIPVAHVAVERSRFAKPAFRIITRTDGTHALSRKSLSNVAINTAIQPQRTKTTTSEVRSDHE